MDTQKLTEQMQQMNSALVTYAAMVKVRKLCKYNNICSHAKLCGDCGLDEFDREQYEKAEEKFERKVALCKQRDGIL
jgi:hypothetical protein